MMWFEEEENEVEEGEEEEVEAVGERSTVTGGTPATRLRPQR